TSGAEHHVSTFRAPFPFLHPYSNKNYWTSFIARHRRGRCSRSARTSAPESLVLAIEEAGKQWLSFNPRDLLHGLTQHGLKDRGCPASRAAGAPAFKLTRYLPAHWPVPIFNFRIPYFISGDAGPTGMGGRGVSPVGAGGSGRSKSGIRLRAENTPLPWSAVGACWGALISRGGSVLGGSGSAPVTGR